ncbi:MAG: hypothetical protein RLZZ504_1213 [Bacteroidota bacterium]
MKNIDPFITPLKKTLLTVLLTPHCIGLMLLTAPTISLSGQHYLIPTRFSQSPTPPKPDYGNPNNWCALPTKMDPSDESPRGYSHNQDRADADVFFIHPTTYTTKPKTVYAWNHDLRDESLNAEVDNSAILYQASAFNLAGKVYAPRYRQAHYAVFLTSHLEDKQAALDTAYTDIHDAFDYYLKYYNQGRPFIIASHSQGTIHAARLLNDFVLNRPLQSQLVAAYIPGMAVPTDSLPGLPPCTHDSSTGCFLSWSTYEKGYTPPYYELALARAVCVNPISWELNESYVPKTLHKGAALRPFHLALPQICDAQVHGGILWVTKPKFRGSWLWTDKNYHMGDINLFYFDIRENAALRVRSFLKQN